MNCEQLREYIASLEAEIAKMPSWKQGTAWHLDRVREIEASKRSLAIREKLA